MSNTSKTIQTTTCESARQTAHRSEWSYVPAIDVYELPDAYVIEADAPGLNPDGIEVTYETGVLHLHGSIAPRYGENISFVRQEYGVGDFDREIPLGRIVEFVDAEKTEAEYAHGVVTIRLPKVELAQPRRIEVKKKSA